MDTLEGNKLIAEFMGHKPYINSVDEDKFYNESYPTLPEYREAVKIPLNFYSNNGSYKPNDWVDSITGNNKMLTERVSIGHLKYNSSWDWLMLVVEKIESLRDITERFDITMHEVIIWAETLSGKKFWVEYSFGKVRLPSFETKIVATYRAVVEFIEWYNRHQPVKK